MPRFAWSPGVADARIDAYERRRKQRAVAYTNVVEKRGRSVAANMDSLHQAYPWLESGVVSSLAQAGHSGRSKTAQELAYAALPKYVRRGGVTPGSPLAQDVVQQHGEDRKARMRAARARAIEAAPDWAQEGLRAGGNAGGLTDTLSGLAGDFADTIPVVNSAKALAEGKGFEGALTSAIPFYNAQRKVLGETPEVGTPAVRGIDTIAKNVVRPVATAANFGTEYIAAGVRQKIGTAQRLYEGQGSIADALVLSDPTGVYGQLRDYTGQDPGPSRVEQTTLGQAGIALAKGENVDLGSGFLPNPDSPIGRRQARAARESASIDGHGATLGRFYASLLTEPGSTEYDILSGLTDAAVQMAPGIDPANAVLGELGRANQARQTFGVSSSVDGLARKEWRKTLLHPNPQEWLDAAPDAQVLKTRLAGESSPSEIRRLLPKDFPMVSAYGDNVIGDLARAQDPAAVSDVMKRVLGITYQDVPKAPGLGYKFKKATADVRLLGLAPTRTSDPSDLQDFVTGAERSMLNAKVPVAKRDAIIDRIILNAENDPLTVKIDQYNAAKHAGDAIKESLVSSGVPADRAQGLTKLFRQSVEEAHSLYARPAADGEALNIPGFYDPTTGQLVDFTEHPLTLAHGLASKIEWPDYREVRRATSFFKPIFDNPVMISHGGKWPGFTALADSFMQKWKLGVLSKPNLMLRVVGEEQFRMAASDFTSVANHPGSAIALALGGSPEHPWMANALKSGGVFTEKAAEVLARKKGMDLAATRASARKAAEAIAESSGEDVEKVAQRLYREKVANGVVAGAGRFVADAQGHPLDPTGFEPGMAAHYQDALYNNWSDYRPDLRKYATGDWQRLPKSNDDWSRGLITELSQAREPVTRATVSMGPDAAKEAFWSGNLKHWRESLGRRAELKPLNDSREASDNYIDTLYAQVQDLTGGDPRLLDAIRTGKFDGKGLVDRWGRPEAETLKKFDALKEEATFGPEKVKYQTMLDVAGKENTRLNRFFDTIFFNLMPRESNYLSRSTTFRQSLWKHNEELLPYLRTADREALIENARIAKLPETDIARLANNAARHPEPEERLALGLEQLDHAAKSMALDDTRKLLYDLSEKGQFSDVFRNVFPFLEAWKEVLGRWATITRKNPSVVRTAEKALAGLKNSGVFHTDELTGQEVYSIPGSSWLNEKLIGVPIPLQGSVSGLNIASTGLPGVGPLVQIPASYLIPDDPKWDGLARAMFPFGDIAKSGDPVTDIALAAAPIPNWLRRTFAAVRDPDNYREQANVVGDIMRYKASTGEYALQGQGGKDPAAEMRRMVEDSKQAAMWFGFIRAGALAIAPSAPSPKWEVKDKDGRLAVAQVLITEFRKMVKAEHGDVGVAQTKWLAKHGDDNYLLLQPFSEPVKGYLPPTDKALDWARSNPDVRDRHSEVYGLFAPQGGKFDISAFSRSFDRAERRGLTPEEMLTAANSRIASHLYSKAKDTSDGSPADEAWLAKYKKALRHDYPGFDDTGYDYRRIPALVDKIAEAVKDPTLAKTDAGIAAKRYMHQYNSVLKDAAAAGYKTLNNNWARDNGYVAWLKKYGKALVADYPDFRSMWRYVFSVQLGGN